MPLRRGGPNRLACRPDRRRRPRRPGCPGLPPCTGVQTSRGRALSGLRRPEVPGRTHNNLGELFPPLRANQRPTGGSIEQEQAPTTTTCTTAACRGGADGGVMGVEQEQAPSHGELSRSRHHVGVGAGGSVGSSLRGILGVGSGLGGGLHSRKDDVVTTCMEDWVIRVGPTQMQALAAAVNKTHDAAGRCVQRWTRATRQPVIGNQRGGGGDRA